MSQPIDSDTLVNQTRNHLEQIGYRSGLLQTDYGFSDVLGEHDGAQTIPLAAFAQEPTSYKTACLGVSLTKSDNPQEIAYCRALGAPMILALRQETSTCRVWKMVANGTPELREEFSTHNLKQEIISRQEQWQPSEVLRSKNITFSQTSPQLDFYDAGLVPAIEAVVYRKLNELLSRVVARAKEVYQERHDQEPDYRLLFQIIFRFIAAKMLGDRKYPGDWLNADASSVLQSVNEFYFHETAAALPPLDAPVRNRVWDTIREAFHFQNLSVEALAYVYENSFVDLETRRAYGTHATPYEVAEYMVRALPIESLPQEERTVFEPFAGAAPFLVAALGRLRELLPDGMDAAERHSYLVRMLIGMELDPFACDIALYSLILADYPNSNGWKVLEDDVFASTQLTSNLTRANVVLCNPPYGSFDALERQKYSLDSAYKAVQSLQHVLRNPPKMLGFVLPLSYQNGQSYRNIRKQIDALYGNVDVVKLPDNIFQHSSIETVLLLAHNEPQSTAHRRSASLSKADYKNFKSTRVISWEVGLPLKLWEELSALPVLSSVADVHRGIEYNQPFRANYLRFVSDIAKPGFMPGLIRVQDGFEPYVVPDRKYLNIDPKLMLYSAYKRSWNLPKLIASAGRMSQDHWLIAAAADYDGLVCTQRFHGLWLKAKTLSLEVLAAVLNGPIANAWLSRHRTGRDNQVRYIKSIPLPNLSPTATELMTRYIDRYVRLQKTAEGMNILLKIDAAVLDAYGLSKKAEGELLAWFDGAHRPGVPGFTGYGSEFEKARAEYRHELAHFQQVERYHDLVDKTFLRELTSQEAQEKERLSRDIDDYNAPFSTSNSQELSHGR